MPSLQIDKLINEKVDVIIADLGISSYQLLHSSRGFSFDEESVLDMRIDKKQPLTAHRIVNNYNIEDLSDVIKNFGEEKNHFKIASAIVRHRSREEIKTCLDLATIIRKTNKSVSKIDAATRTFQALRLEVNGELTSLEAFLSKSWSVLKEGGKLIVISFHSLEDRLVKQFFKYSETECICPPSIMICECTKKQTLKILPKKSLGQNFLTDGQLQFVREWIEAGAPEEGVVATEELLLDSNNYSPPEFTPLKPPKKGIQLHLKPFEVMPNFEREFFQYTNLDVSEDIYANRIQIEMRPGSHHFILYSFIKNLFTLKFDIYEN